MFGNDDALICIRFLISHDSSTSSEWKNIANTLSDSSILAIGLGERITARTDLWMDGDLFLKVKAY